MLHRTQQPTTGFISHPEQTLTTPPCVAGMREHIQWRAVVADLNYLRVHLPLLPPVIESLELTNVRFESLDGIKLFIDAMRGRVVRSLCIDHCLMTQIQIMHLVHLLGSMETHTLILRNLELNDAICDHIQEFGATLQHLVLAHNKLSGVGLGTLSLMKLQSLDVSFNCFDDFTQWRTLFSNTDSVSVAGCFTTPSMFARACDRFDGGAWNLKCLDVSKNRLTVYETAKLVHAMRNTSIQELCMADNALNDKALALVAQSKTIMYAFLDANPAISNIGALEASKVYQTNFTLKHLSLKACGLADNLMDIYAKLNDNHRRLRTIAQCVLENMMLNRDIIDDANALL